MTEQQQHLRIIRGIAILAAAGIVILGWALYMGYELPFWEMRDQHTDSTGYAAPPRMSAVTAAGVPRHIDLSPTAPPIEPPLPNPPDGSIPPQAAALANPLGGSPAAVARGKAVYDINCVQCHGPAGRGNGPVGSSYVPAPTDLTRPQTQALPDGALYYTITNGILSTPVPTAGRYLPREWHGYQDVLSVEDRWAVVSYMKTLGGAHATAR